MLVLAVAEDLDKLLKNCRLTSIAALSETGGVVKMTVDIAIVLVVAVLSAEHSRAHAARKVVDVVLAIKCSDVRAAQRSAALVAKQAKTSEVVGFAEGVLSVAIVVVGGEEFGGDDLTAILEHELAVTVCNSSKKGS